MKAININHRPEDGLKSVIGERVAVYARGFVYGTAFVGPNGGEGKFEQARFFSKPLPWIGRRGVFEIDDMWVVE